MIPVRRFPGEEEAIVHRFAQQIAIGRHGADTVVRVGAECERIFLADPDVAAVVQWIYIPTDEENDLWEDDTNPLDASTEVHKRETAARQALGLPPEPAPLIR